MEPGCLKVGFSVLKSIWLGHLQYMGIYTIVQAVCPSCIFIVLLAGLHIIKNIYHCKHAEKLSGHMEGSAELKNGKISGQMLLFIQRLSSYSTSDQIISLRRQIVIISQISFLYPRVFLFSISQLQPLWK